MKLTEVEAAIRDALDQINRADPGYTRLLHTVPEPRDRT
mgnify:CR=1 FL=1